ANRLGLGPGKGKEPLGLHFLHHRFPFDVLIAGMSNLAARDLTQYKRSIQFHAKPLAKLAVISQRTPDSGDRRFEFNTLLNTVTHVMQPLGCILISPETKC